MLQTLLIMVITILATGLLLGITPYIVRRNIHFGVMLPDHASELPITRKWKKQFLGWSIVASIVGVIPIFIGSFLSLDEEAMTNYIAIVGTIMILLVTAFHIVLYFYYHGQAKLLKEQQFSGEEIRRDARIMVSTDFHQQKMIVSNKWLTVLGGAIILVTVMLPILMYDQIPAYVPVNWDTAGVARFAPRTPMIFILAPAIQVGMLLLFILSNYSFKITKQMLNPKSAKASAMQNRAYRYAMSKFMTMVGIATLLLMSGLQLMMVFAVHDPMWIGWVGIGFAGAVLLGVIYLAWKYGQGGERYRRNKSVAEQIQTHQMLDDDQFWKWGMFYYNPNDPAIFVEKRFGIGITLNFARPQAWWMMVGILVFIIGITVASVIMVGAM